MLLKSSDFYFGDDQPAPSVSKSGLLEPIDDVDEVSEIQ